MMRTWADEDVGGAGMVHGFLIGIVKDAIRFVPELGPLAEPIIKASTVEDDINEEEKPTIEIGRRWEAAKDGLNERTARSMLKGMIAIDPADQRCGR